MKPRLQKRKGLWQCSGAGVTGISTTGIGQDMPTAFREWQFLQCQLMSNKAPAGWRL